MDKIYTSQLMPNEDINRMNPTITHLNAILNWANEYINEHENMLHENNYVEIKRNSLNSYTVVFYDEGSENTFDLILDLDQVVDCNHTSTLRY